MQPIPETSTTFSNAQLLLLKAFFSNLTEEELLHLQHAYAQILGRRVIVGANEVWDEKGWTTDTM